MGNIKYSGFQASKDLHLTQHKINTIIKMIMNTVLCLAQVDQKIEEKWGLFWFPWRCLVSSEIAEV